MLDNTPRTPEVGPLGFWHPEHSGDGDACSLEF